MAQTRVDRQPVEDHIGTGRRGEQKGERDASTAVAGDAGGDYDGVPAGRDDGAAGAAGGGLVALPGAGFVRDLFRDLFGAGARSPERAPAWAVGREHPAELFGLVNFHYHP